MAPRRQPNRFTTLDCLDPLLGNRFGAYGVVNNTDGELARADRDTAALVPTIAPGGNASDSPYTRTLLAP